MFISQLHFLVLTLISCAYSRPLVQLSKIRQIVASVGLGTSIFLGSGPSHAGMNTDASTNSLANVMRVSYSLKLIDKQITTVGDVKQVVTQIEKLMQNYKLKDNLKLSYDLIENNKKDEARSHGNQALEDLTLVNEYFESEIDNMSGKKKIPREVLKFASQASVACQKELAELFKSYPPSIMTAVQTQIGEEFSFVAAE
mmetsp:Transcript_5095/g.5224  ORF Transcript_5095/g.5224 Transcript_5095/m.5224 type:complete len:199 (+) Transcript_5095:92-688(+)